MSSFDRRTFLLMPLALAACGFTPVYGPGGTGTALQGKVLVDAPGDQDGYLLVRNLEQRLGRAAAPDYRLGYELATEQQGQAVTSAGEITRYSIIGTAQYTLRRLADDTILASGRVRNFTGYSATGSTVQTLAAEKDARERLMVILADQIVARLFATADLSA